MRRSIFYSWQSDSPNATNRAFVQDAADKAIKKLSGDLHPELAPAIDRDTAGLPGSPEISGTIFDKIARSDAFIADVTITTESGARRPSPNPNILIETGYASSAIGWNNIILVMNTFFGGPEKLPFDLRGRRVVPYNLDPAETDRTVARKSLVGQLQHALKQALQKTIEGSRDGLAGPDSLIWWGKWEINSRDNLTSGTLFIREVSSIGFMYSLATSYGSHTGDIYGYARITSENAAFSQHADTEETCELQFKRSLVDGIRTINVTESDGCRYQHGARASFSGDFIRTEDSIFDNGLVNETDLSQLYRLTGKHFDRFLVCMGAYSHEEDLDGLSARVLSGGVAGLYTIMEAILMVGVNGRMWAAYLDNGKVTYFANKKKWRKKLPLTIQKWMEDFADAKVIYASPIDYIDDDPKFAWSE